MNRCDCGHDRALHLVSSEAGIVRPEGSVLWRSVEGAREARTACTAQGCDCARYVERWVTLADGTELHLDHGAKWTPVPPLDHRTDDPDNAQLDERFGRIVDEYLGRPRKT